MSRSSRRMSLRGLPIGARLALIAGLFAATVFGVGAVAWQALDAAAAVTAGVSRLSRAQEFQQDADMMHDGIKAGVFALLSNEAAAGGRQGKLNSLRSSAGRLRSDLTALMEFPFAPELASVVADNVSLAETYIVTAEDVALLAVYDRPAALLAVAAFERTFERMLAAMTAQSHLLGTEIVLMERRSDEASRAAKQRIALAGLVAVLASVLLVAAVGRSVQASLRQIGGVAQAMAAGNLDVRSDVVSRDALGTLAQSINRLAQHLQETMGRMRADVERAAFGNQLGQALEMAPSEAQAHAVVASAMYAVSGRHGMELLVADASQTRLERATEHPSQGAPGCGAARPADCVVMRRGGAIAFADSEAVNACPRLRGRPGGRVAAVCVPVTCMGRAIGVLHAAGPVSEPLAAHQIAQLAMLGNQAGARIGSIRSWQRMPALASLDSVSGLLNRRALAREMRNVVKAESLLPPSAPSPSVFRT